MRHFFLLFVAGIMYATALCGCDALLFPGAERHYNGVHNFSIQLPKDWEVMEDVGGTAIAALSPYSSTTDLFQENVNVTVGPLPQGVSLEEYFSLNTGEVGNFLLNFERKSNGDTRINHGKAYFIIYAYQVGSLKLQTLMYMLEKERNVYIITCTAEVHVFSKQKNTFQKIAKSFKFFK